MGTIKELCMIISYTPQLRRLNFTLGNDNNSNMGVISPLTLSNLTHLSMDLSFMKFDDFELLIAKIYSNLKVLSVITLCDETAYFNANR